jgi:hypothetical protein
MPKQVTQAAVCKSNQIERKKIDWLTFWCFQVRAKVKQLNQRVDRILTSRIRKKIIFSLQISLKRLWGTEKPPAFKEMMVLLSLLKDIEGSSFADLQNEIEDCLPISKGSIEHNVQVIRQELRLWAKTVVVPTSPKILERMAKWVDRPPPTTKVSLWVDSTDFRKTGKRRMKDDRKSWSHKLSSPGRRWMTITNAHGIAQ